MTVVITDQGIMKIVPDADINTRAVAACVLEFKISNPNTYVCPALIVWLVATLSLRAPKLHVPAAGDMPSENKRCPPVPSAVSVMEVLATAFENPDIVTVVLSLPNKSTFVCSVIVTLFAPSARGLLWPTLLVTNASTTGSLITFIGFPPSVTYLLGMSVVMTPLEAGNVAVPEASILAAAASCAADGFVISNEKMYWIPAGTVWPVKTVSVNLPESNTPLPCVVPTEKKSAPLFATLVSARLASSDALASPDIVSLEVSAAAKFILD
jgi:hypothetical protein